METKKYIYIKLNLKDITFVHPNFADVFIIHSLLKILFIQVYKCVIYVKIFISKKLLFYKIQINI